jgi:hypothetical protein
MDQCRKGRAMAINTINIVTNDEVHPSVDAASSTGCHETSIPA